MADSWIASFQDNFAALQDSAVSTAAAASQDLQSEYQYLLTEGATLSQYLAANTSGAAVASDVQSVGARAQTWLNDTKTFAGALTTDAQNAEASALSAVQGDVNAATDGVENAYDHVTSGIYNAAMNASMHIVNTSDAALADLQAALGEIGAIPGNVAASVTGALGSVPWLWIALGVGAIVLLPTILDALEDDD